MRSLALLVVVVVFGMVHVDSKTVTGSFQLEAGDFDTGPEYEITKFSFAIGESKIDGKFSYKDAHTWMTSPALYLFRDDQWDAYHKAPSCMDKVEIASAMVPIGRMTQSHRDILHVGEGKANHSKVTEVGNGMVEWEFSWVIDHKERTHGWFVIVADCALEQYNTRVPPMTYELHLLNPGNTHLPADEYGLPKLYLMAFFIMAFYLAYLSTLLRKHFEESKKVHLVVRLLLVAYVLQLCSFGFELVHLFIYKGNGKGVYLFDLLSEVFEGAAQTLISFVLICLGSGWTLVEVEADSARATSVSTLFSNPTSLFKGPNAGIFMIIVFVVLSTFLQIANKAMDDDFSKFHDFESTPGKFLVMIRLFLGVAFVLSLHFTIKSQATRGGDRLVEFLRRLMFLGGVFFLSFPLTVFFASFLVHYNRHRFVTGMMMLISSSSLAILGHQFLSHHSTYFKLSTLADSGVLPGAGGLVRAPKVSRD